VGDNVVLFFGGVCYGARKGLQILYSEESCRRNLPVGLTS